MILNIVVTLYCKMLIIGNSVKVNILSRFFFRTVLLFSLTVLFGLFFSQRISVPTSGTTETKNVSEFDANFVLSTATYTAAHYPLQFPIESKLKIEETEETEDTKPKNTVKSAAKKYFENHRYQIKERSSSDKSILTHLRLSFYNRATISLITLHHTWKIFLI